MKIVISGSASCGKTSVINELASRGFKVFEDTPRKILTERKNHLALRPEIELRQEKVISLQIAKEKIPDLKLLIAGDAGTRYGKKVLDYINNSKYKDSINYFGKVSTDKKLELLQKSHIICVTSVKEGWGIIVTEANSQGTPAITYNVDGLRDSVRHNRTGILCQQNNPENLAKNIIKLLGDREKYQNLRINAWQWSKEINFDRSDKEFLKILKLKTL